MCLLVYKSLEHVNLVSTCISAIYADIDFHRTVVSGWSFIYTQLVLVTL